MKMLHERERQTDAPVSLSTLKTAVDRGSRSDRPRYHDHNRWTLPLPLAANKPRSSEKNNGQVPVGEKIEWR